MNATHDTTIAKTPAAKRAIITGISGQDGSYLAELLLEKGYEVHGIVRRSSTMNRGRIDDLLTGGKGKSRLHLHYGDVTDANFVARLVVELEPHEVYNLAAQSHVRVSFDNPVYTTHTDALGALHVLEAARLLHPRHVVKVYQASTSEMFGGDPSTVPQSEKTPFHPRSPYACAKVCAHHQVANYREAYGMFCCSGILFNHESPRRGEAFVTRKVTLAATRIREGLQEKLFLGNLDAKRDWGYAKDYVEAMWLMLQQDQPDDFVIATGQAHSIRELLDEAFRRVELDWRKYVDHDIRLERPSEVHLLLGDATKAREKLNWTAKTSFAELIALMVDADWELAKEEARRRERAPIAAAAR